MLTHLASLEKSSQRAVTLLDRSWKCWKRFLNNGSASSKHASSVPSALRRVEVMALEKTHSIHRVQEESIRFSDTSNDLSPLHLIRGLHAFANIGFCNKELLVSFGERVDELCEHASPKRVLHLLTLAKRMNITHPTVAKPLLAAVKRNLHNYVEELSDAILNTSHISTDDHDLVELFRTQALLNIDAIGRASIRTAEALSRYRQKSCTVLDHVKSKTIPELENLTLKQQLYLLAAFGRHSQKSECKKLLNAILHKWSSSTPNEEDTSRILTLQSAIGVVAPKLLDAVVEDIEVRLKDTHYVNKTFPYHLYTLCLLGKTKPKTLSALLRRALDKGVVPDSAVAASQLLCSIALSGNVDKELMEHKSVQALTRQIEASHLRLSIPQQSELYGALICLRKYIDLPPALSSFVATKLPSSIPVMCGMAPEQDIGTVGGVNYVYQEISHGSNEIFLCVNESGVLTVVEGTPSVIMRPRLSHQRDVLESLLKEHPEYSGKHTISLRMSPMLKDKL